MGLIIKVENSLDILNPVAPLEPSPTWFECSKRITEAALPFFTLHPLSAYPASLGIATFRVWNSSSSIYKRGLYKEITWTLAWHGIRVTVAIIAFAAAVFSHAIGMRLLMTRDFLEELSTLLSAIYAKNPRDILKSLIKTIRYALTLTLLCCYAGVELSILVMGLRALVLLISSTEKFQKSGWLDWSEGGADLAMSAIRASQAFSQLFVSYFDDTCEADTA